LIEKAIGVGFFYYGPRMWMIGEVEPLKALQQPEARTTIIDRILVEYPTKDLAVDESFYRIRTALNNPTDFAEFDSPPIPKAGNNRLDSANFPVMYGSQDLQVCIHECRVTAEDEILLQRSHPPES
jgi:hypothetical protein